MKKIFSWSLAGFLGILAFYLATHLPALTRLPVFADEAIYIRWAQLILDDWHRYLFFPLNDGKTPLFVWLVVGSLKIFTNPLIAGRIVALLAGLVQVFVTAQIVKKLGGKTMAVLSSILMVTLLPFWYFHHRIALMDGLMTMFLSLSWLYLIHALQNKKEQWLWLGLTGISFGLALLTKLPALLFIPALGIAALLSKPKKMPLATLMSFGAGSLLVGLLVFLSLKIQPNFGQLFTRGNDFLYPVSEVLARGVWSVIWINAKTALSTLGAYLTWPVLLLPLTGLFQDKWRKTHGWLILAALSFMAPILLLGKTIYPRYFLPVALPITVSAALAFGQFFDYTKKLVKRPLHFIVRCALLVLGLTYVMSTILEFMLISWQNPDYLPYTPQDRSQYAWEWSSGHGVWETTQMLEATAQNHTIAVATEGFFGTLPDAMLMYLHNQNVTNILVEGIGQPVHEIPQQFIEKAQQYEYVWLVVNDYREKMGLNTGKTEGELISWYCRVPGAPCLQVWDITDLVHQKN